MMNLGLYYNETHRACFTFPHYSLLKVVTWGYMRFEISQVTKCNVWEDSLVSSGCQTYIQCCITTTGLIFMKFYMLGYFWQISFFSSNFEGGCYKKNYTNYFFIKIYYRVKYQVLRNK